MDAASRLGRTAGVASVTLDIVNGGGSDTRPSPTGIVQLITEIQALIDENKELKRQLAESQNNNRKKLTFQDAEHIRQLSRQGYTQAEIAAAYDVNPATVSRIVNGVYH